jgi:hypothetical protein
VELVQQQHLNALSAVPLQRARPQESRELGELQSKRDGAEIHREAQREPCIRLSMLHELQERAALRAHLPHLRGADAVRAGCAARTVRCAARRGGCCAARTARFQVQGRQHLQHVASEQARPTCRNQAPGEDAAPCAAGPAACRRASRANTPPHAADRGCTHTCPAAAAPRSSSARPAPHSQ